MTKQRRRTFELNRLGRSKMPAYLKTLNVDTQTRSLDPHSSEYKNLLRKKIQEETNEVISAQDNQELTEELGDLLEVIDTLIWAYGLSREEIERARTAKNSERGDFKAGLLVTRVTVPADNPRIPYWESNPETPEIL